MRTIDLVCLCEQYDIKSEFGPGFQAVAPWIRVLDPAEVEDHASIRHAMVFRPGPRAFEPYPNLQLVCSVAAGVERLLAHPDLGPAVAITRMIDREQALMVAGFALWHVVGWHRGMWRYAQQQAARIWKENLSDPPSAFPVGVLGYGHVGRTVCEVFAGAGYKVTAFASGEKAGAAVPVLWGKDSLARIFETSRAVVNVLPLTAGTTGIVSRERLSSMRSDAILVHLGRGGQLDEEDLCAALDQGRPAMAAVDVTAVEPTPDGHPFWSHQKVVLTPHAAGVANSVAAASSIAQCIRRFEAGEPPPGLVDRQRGY